jgi:hypothetical protein
MAVRFPGTALNPYQATSPVPSTPFSATFWAMIVASTNNTLSGGTGATTEADPPVGVVGRPLLRRYLAGNPRGLRRRWL